MFHVFFKKISKRLICQVSRKLLFVKILSTKKSIFSIYSWTIDFFKTKKHHWVAFHTNVLQCKIDKKQFIVAFKHILLASRHKWPQYSCAVTPRRKIDTIKYNVITMVWWAHKKNAKNMYINILVFYWQN